jgi:hypothetical protein
MTGFVDPPVYPHIEIFPPVMNANGNLVSTQYPTLVSERIPASAHITLRRVRRTHRELHEEVLGADAPVNESTEQTIDEPPEGIRARGRARSKSIIAHPAVPQAGPLPVPPIPPIPMSLRMSSSNAEAWHSDLSTPPSEARSRPKDRPTSYIISNTPPSPIRNGGSIVRSNSYTTANSSLRRDHGHSKQSLRPRDSLVLEKARYFDQLHSLRKVTTSW